MILTFELDLDMVMIKPHAKIQVPTSNGSNLRALTDGQTDRRTDRQTLPITLSPRLMAGDNEYTEKHLYMPFHGNPMESFLDIMQLAENYIPNFMLTYF